jgi:hypothetical protein
MHNVRIFKIHPSRETVCLTEAILPFSYLLINKKRSRNIYIVTVYPETKAVNETIDR